jgi:preprotein translocase subunit SecD
MRSRSIRLSISIILILGIAIAALGFKDINIEIPGFPRIERDGTGPLGLKLGLDLRGGGHLVYQADTGPSLKSPLPMKSPSMIWSPHCKTCGLAMTTTN